MTFYWYTKTEAQYTIHTILFPDRTLYLTNYTNCTRSTGWLVDYRCTVELLYNLNVKKRKLRLALRHETLPGDRAFWKMNTAVCTAIGVNSAWNDSSLGIIVATDVRLKWICSCSEMFSSSLFFEFGVLNNYRSNPPSLTCSLACGIFCVKSFFFSSFFLLSTLSSVWKLFFSSTCLE